ncbi:MAG: DUF6364 family protein [Candidatus Neomarinimicrobiota bacterium]|jgi:hypothetical protein|nr:DUF6364 family protein [Candidatus Neomarinimicrobiota bacterium]MDX9781023.1 DUF6364 family protein [bacterium]
MQTKLTLRMDEELIKSAKDFAERKGKSLSRMVADYFSRLNRQETHPAAPPPHVRALSGALKGSALDEEDYKAHLEKKHR